MKSFLWRHKVLVGIWAIVFGMAGYGAFLVLGTQTGNPNPYVLSNQTDKDSSQQKPQETEESAEVGQAVTDENLEMTAKGITCNDKTIGTNQYAQDEATGVFCRLQLSIKNTGGSAQSLPVSRMKLFDTDGKEYKFDDQATLYAQTDLTSAIWYENVGAGATASGDIVFDISVDATPDKVQIFGGQTSEGVEVKF